jgi:hypothetical protein
VTQDGNKMPRALAEAQEFEGFLLDASLLSFFPLEGSSGIPYVSIQDVVVCIIIFIRFCENLLDSLSKTYNK